MVRQWAEKEIVGFECCPYHWLDLQVRDWAKYISIWKRAEPGSKVINCSAVKPGDPRAEFLLYFQNQSEDARCIHLITDSRIYLEQLLHSSALPNKRAEQDFALSQISPEAMLPIRAQCLKGFGCSYNATKIWTIKQIQEKRRICQDDLNFHEIAGGHVCHIVQDIDACRFLSGTLGQVGSLICFARSVSLSLTKLNYFILTYWERSEPHR